MHEVRSLTANPSMHMMNQNADQSSEGCEQAHMSASTCTICLLCAVIFAFFLPLSMALISLPRRIKATWQWYKLKNSKIIDKWPPDKWATKWEQTCYGQAPELVKQYQERLDLRRYSATWLESEPKPYEPLHRKIHNDWVLMPESTFLHRYLHYFLCGYSCFLRLLCPQSLAPHPPLRIQELWQRKQRAIKGQEDQEKKALRLCIFLPVFWCLSLQRLSA